MMADSNNAVLSPVGAVWHYIRHNFPSIELYQADESHPSLAGSYAGACCFYTTLFRKDPTFISFDSSLPAADAANIRNAVKVVVYDSLLNWHIGEYDPTANFTYSVSNPHEAAFTNLSENADAFNWNFGDGDTSTALNPVHIYTMSGPYMVTLVATHCGISDTTTQTITAATGIQSHEIEHVVQLVYPNPASQTLTIILTVLGNLDYRIVSPVGEKILLGTITTLDNQIDVSSLSSGIYFLELFHHAGLRDRIKFLKVYN
jgi:hypothetical protein